jgi:kynurenine formamidase
MRAQPSIEQLLADAPNNWGKWGENDEIGSLNYLTREQVLRGIATVRRGEVFPLATRIARPEGDPVMPGRWPPRKFMVADRAGFVSGRWHDMPGGMEFADDYLTGFAQSGTHSDALGHMWFGTEIWNGHPADSTNGGMSYAGIEPIAGHGIVGRCVLLDIARHRGKPRLERAETIGLDDLLNCAAAQGTELPPRSILLIRTGWLAAVERGEELVDENYWEPGLTYSPELVSWFQENEIPCLVTDTMANETTYEPVTGIQLPLHAALMRNLGVVFTEMADLDALADDCAKDGEYQAFFCASPLKISDATGSSINPVVVK